MNPKQFIGLQAFELVYLLILAFLPFVVAQRAVGLTILAITVVGAVYYGVRRLLSKTIEISGKSVLITGCDSGFGNAVARRLEAIGFTVFAGCLYENSEGAKRLRTSTTGRMCVIQLDITSDESVAKCFEKVNELCGSTGLWSLMNNAGVNFAGDVEFCTLEMYRRIAEVNMFGTIRMTKAFLPLIRTAKGRVVNVTSAKGKLSLPSNSVYGATKFAIETFSDILRLEMSQFGVKVIVIEPGNFGGATGMLNRESLANMREDYDEMWKSASENVKQAYGKEYLEAQYKELVQSASSTCSTLGPVVDSMEDAIINASPYIRYLVNGSNKWYDFNNVLIWMKTFLPDECIDMLIHRAYIKPLPSPAHGI